MSKVTVDNLRKASESADRDISGVAAAWVNFNGTGTIAARDSLNVSSLTDHGVGGYTTNLTSNFNAADWCASHSADRVAGTAEVTTSPYAVLVGSVRVNTIRADTYANIDTASVYKAGFGDLA